MATNTTLDAFTKNRWHGRDYLISPVVDFLMAGALGLVAVIALVTFYPAAMPSYAPLFVLYIPFLINNPHLAYSYILLYERFGEKLSGREQPELRNRYIFAGIIIPLLMLTYLGYGVATENIVLIDLLFSVSMLLNGLHYVKQCYGVFILLSLIKHIHYNASEKRVLLSNMYIVWLTTWLNFALMSGVLKGLPDGILAVLNVLNSVIIPLVAAGFLSVAWVLVKKHMKQGRPSFTALTGYFSVYYLWGLAFVVHPFWLTVSALFHCIQYMHFTFAYKLYETRFNIHHQTRPQVNEWRRFYGFVAMGLVLGLVGLLALPAFMDATLPLNQEVFFRGMAPLLLLFFNTHHYFIDAVIWRKENKKIGQYLLFRPA